MTPFVSALVGGGLFFWLSERGDIRGMSPWLAAFVGAAGGAILIPTVTGVR